jgi:hypothetical protein
MGSQGGQYGVEISEALDRAVQPGRAAKHPERWSTPRKTELVLRLLRGEALDAVSRESQVPAHELEAWQRAFLEAGSHTLEQAQPIIGEYITRYNTQWLIERLGHRTPTQVRAEAQRPRAA